MNGVLLDLGVVQIYWYSICIILGMAVGMALVYKEAAKKGISESAITDIVFYTIIIAIIGARLYYVALEWNKYKDNPLSALEIWHGGLAIHGAIILGGLFLILHSKRKRIDTLKLLDICSVGLIIGQAIGRWGNFFNQEVYGGVVPESGFFASIFKILPNFIQEGMKIGGEYHQPLFLYESILCLLGFIILLIMRRRKYIKTGQVFGIYCVWYGTVRLILEGMRVSKYNLTIGPVKVAQIVSIGMIVVGLFFIIRRFRTSRFDYLYNAETVLRKVENVDDRTPYTGYSDNTNTNRTTQPVEVGSSELFVATAPVVNAAQSVEPVTEVATEPATVAPQGPMLGPLPVASEPTAEPVTQTEVVTEPVTNAPIELPTVPKEIPVQSETPVEPVTEVPVNQDIQELMKKNAAAIITQEVVTEPVTNAPIELPTVPPDPVTEPAPVAPVQEVNVEPAQTDAPAPSGNKFITD